MIAIETRDLAKIYKDARAVDGVSLNLEEDRIYGLLGRNGAGKTTLMKLLTGQVFASHGEMTLFGENPVENADILARTCFIQESQRYPDNFRAKEVLAVAASV
ncbi:ATP-binding cassette domain-containing protein [Paramicrobacterium sp. CJ85]|uniref:ATP-binding cassette domain-containing protein n=1 Tax=Paramicrobacterium sp. CJ85 TaxID=3445355 RepID=UPI003F62E30B